MSHQVAVLPHDLHSVNLMTKKQACPIIQARHLELLQNWECAFDTRQILARHCNTDLNHELYIVIAVESSAALVLMW